MIAAILQTLPILLYPMMLMAAAYLNKSSIENLALLLIVALTFYLPMNLIENYYSWYAVAILAEVLVIALAIKVDSLASPVISSLTGLLLLSHITSLFSSNYTHYSIVAKYLEHLQMLAFIVASPPIINKLKRKMRCLV